MNRATRERLAAIRAMAFFHPDGLVPSWKFAQQFAGKGGRVGTLPDIIDSRLSEALGTPAWESYHTTASAEYLGRSRGGNWIIVVAHGVGPMATLDGVTAAYSYQFRDRDRQRKGGRISEAEFRKLESGAYGEVSIVDLAMYLRRYQYPFTQNLRASEALLDPVVSARYGPRAGAYIERHAAFARRWHEEMISSTEENRYEIDPARWERSQQAKKEMHSSFARPGSDPYIVQVECDSSAYEFRKPDDGLAFAHLLRIGGLCHLHQEGIVCLHSNTDLFGWNDGCRLVGVREGAQRVAQIHPGASYDKLRKVLWGDIRWLLRPEVESGHERFYALWSLDSEPPFSASSCFTQYPKVGASMDTGAPHHVVRELQPIGEPVEFRTEICGHPIFFRSDLKEVKSLAPRGANAYIIVGEPSLAPDGEHHRASIQFFNVVVDTSHRIVTSKELYQDFDLYCQLAAYEAH